MSHALNPALLGKCGFYCGSCPTLLEGSCPGCLEAHRPGDCYTRDCVLKQGIPACGMCKCFPCDVILEQERCTVLDKAWLQWKNSRAKRRHSLKKSAKAARCFDVRKAAGKEEAECTF